MRRIAIATIAALLVSTQAQASNVPSGYVSSVSITGSRVFIYMTGARTGSALGCCDRWEIDGSTTIGQANLSIALTALTAHRPAALYGTGSLVAGANDTEGLSYLQIQ